MRFAELRPPRRAAPRPRRLALLAVQLACLSLHALAQQQSAAAPPGTAGGVRLTVTVTDGKGRYVSGLAREQFSVTEGKSPRAISLFDGEGDRPASVGILFDVSGSMTGWVEVARVAFAQFVKQGHPETEYLIAQFNTHGHILSGWTSDRGRLTDTIRQVGATLGPRGAGGRTSLYDACSAALARVGQGRHARRALIVVTDGQDSQSRTTYQELKREVRESDALVYFITPVDRNSPSMMDMNGQALAEALSSASGGRAFFPETKLELQEAAERLALELSHQYVVGFTPADEAGGRGWNKVKVKVAKPQTLKGSIHVRSREGYFPRGAAAAREP